MDHEMGKPGSYYDWIRLKWFLPIALSFLLIHSPFFLFEFFLLEITSLFLTPHVTISIHCIITQFTLALSDVYVRGRLRVLVDFGYWGPNTGMVWLRAMYVGSWRIGLEEKKLIQLVFSIHYPFDFLKMLFRYDLNWSNLNWFGLN